MSDETKATTELTATEATTTEVKPGWKTTEFWLSAIVTLAGLVVASGAFSDTSSVAKAVSLIVSGLATLGYTTSRTTAKS
jgi:hypothetical protein